MWYRLTCRPPTSIGSGVVRNRSVNAMGHTLNRSTDTDIFHKAFTSRPHGLHSCVLSVMGMQERKRRVLVVEDEPTIAESVAARLRAEGFAVDIARDGPGGVAAARDGRPDV